MLCDAVPRSAHLLCLHHPEALGAVLAREARHRLLPAAPAVAVSHLMAVQHVLKPVVLQLHNAAASYLQR